MRPLQSRPAVVTLHIPPVSGSGSDAISRVRLSPSHRQLNTAFNSGSPSGCDSTNISNWVTHGGYAEWCALSNDALQTSLRQDALLQYHRTDYSLALAEIGLQSAAARLSELLVHHTAHSSGTEGNLSKLEPVVTLLCRINKELLNLQKYRDDCQTKAYRTPARIRAKEHDKLVELEAQYSASAPKKLVDNERSDPKPASTAKSPPAPIAVAQASADTDGTVSSTPESAPPPETPTPSKTASPDPVSLAQPRQTAESAPHQPADPMMLERALPDER